MFFDVGKLKTVTVNQPGVLFYPYPLSGRGHEAPLVVLVHGGDVAEGMLAVYLSGDHAFSAFRVSSEGGVLGILAPVDDLAIELADDHRSCEAQEIPGQIAVDPNGPGFVVKPDVGFKDECFVSFSNWTLSQIHGEKRVWFDQWRLVSRRASQMQVLVDRRPPCAAKGQAG